MVVGVGGQGVLLISKALALIGQKEGFQVKQSEVHGMAKRGGVVFSHVRFGAQVWSPTIAKGEADALIALEWAEGLRWLEYLRPGAGLFIADTRRIVPPFSCRDRRLGAATQYARETPAEIAGKVAESYALDATTIATELGEPRAANTVLLGVFSTLMSYSVEDWLATIDVARAGEDARDQPQCVRGRPRLGGNRARRSVVPLRAGVARRHGARAAPRRRGRRDRRSLVQGLRHLRHAVPRAVSGD